MIENWLARQAENAARTWEKAIDTFYPEHSGTWSNPSQQLQALREEWNTLDAAMAIDWRRFLTGEGKRILDLGAGTGWLSAILSRRDEVARIDALDSSRQNLESMLPKMTVLLQGNVSKIRPIWGVFTPLLAPDGSYDLAVASSAMHHCPDLSEALSEVYRVLRPGAYFLILNETPSSSAAYAGSAFLQFLRVLRTLLLKRWRPLVPSVSESGILYDPHLGDRMYCLWQWQAAIEAAGFSCETMPSGLPQYKHRAESSLLVHFVARKPSAS